MNEKITCGDLIISTTSDYNFSYTDAGSGAHGDVRFWHPIPPIGFSALGSIARPNNNEVKGIVTTVCVKSVEGKNATAHPEGYTLIWKDRGSGADMDGSCWRPNAPFGYVALGDVFVTGYNEPARDCVVCVREDLTHHARIRNVIWNDKGSGAKSDFSCWELVPPETNPDLEKRYFTANTFVASTNYNPDHDAKVNHCLMLTTNSMNSNEFKTLQLES